MNLTPADSKSSFQVKLIHVFLDDAAISPSEGFLIRKGPGNCHFDFAQEILFIDYLQTPTDNKSAEDYHKYGPPMLQACLCILCRGLINTWIYDVIVSHSDAAAGGRNKLAWTTRLPSCLVGVSCFYVHFQAAFSHHSETINWLAFLNTFRKKWFIF